MRLTRREQATAALYADLHARASDSYALEYLLPGFLTHLSRLGLAPDTAVRGKSVLDAGCGGFGGGVAVALALGAASATGIDFSEANMKAARRRFADAPNAHFQVGNLLDLQVPDASFDFVYCSGVLMITEDPPRAFRELVRVLKPGGRIYIGVYGRGGLFNQVAVPAMKLAGRLVPRPVTSRLLTLVPCLLKPSSSLMDFMYVPIEIHYRIPEVEAWFTALGMQPTFLRHYREPETWWNRLLFGDGTMIFFSAVKPCPQAI
ncbi:MAG: class I SAM-dependent methyltransferase [Acidobacteria bacterium]|nr:class I SAM-dependent methyltransferase [Acidobacteriota bacterium]